MKSLKKYRYLLLLLALPAIVITCIRIGQVIHPDNPKADSDIEIKVELRYELDNLNWGQKIAFGVLAPTAWNLRENAELFLTADFTDPAKSIADEPMSLIAAGENAPGFDYDGTGSRVLPWADAFMARYGRMNNPDDMDLEWVVFESQTVFNIADGRDAAEGYVIIKLHTGKENVTVNMGYAFCGRDRGVEDKGSMEENNSVWTYKQMAVTGGVAPVTMGEITQADKQPVVETPFDIVAKTRIARPIKLDAPMAFGVLVPDGWGADLHISTSGHAGGDMNDEQMVDISSEAYPQGGSTWSEAYMQKFGMMNNVAEGALKWMVFRTASAFDTDGESSDTAGEITITLTPDERNIKFHTGYAACDAGYGFPVTQKYEVASSVVLVGGGEGEVTDYRIDRPQDDPDAVAFSTSPEVFGFGDIIAVRTNTALDYYEALGSATRVFFNAKAICTDGTELSVEMVEMKRESGSIWVKYIHPESLFGLPEGKTISRIDISFSNYDGTVTVDDMGNAFEIVEIAGPASPAR